MSEAVQNGNGQLAQAGEVPQDKKLATEWFLGRVERQFVAELGAGPKFSALEKRLAQHMYLSVDAALTRSETERVSKGKRDKTPFTWQTIDLQNLALDTVHRISLGLDALLKNHVHPVFYWSNHKKKYDVDLQVGFNGADYIARKHALVPPKQIYYHLVYETDRFVALFKDSTRDVEGFEFDVPQPFKRGDIVGGFGYITYDDPGQNKLVLVTQDDFERSRAAGNAGMWRDNWVQMHQKTVVLRTTDKVPLDPEKVNAASFAAVFTENAIPTIDVEAAASGNRQLVDVPRVPTVDADPPRSQVAPTEPADGLTEEDKAEALQREAAEGELFERDKVQARRGPGY